MVWIIAGIALLLALLAGVELEDRRPMGPRGKSAKQRSAGSHTDASARREPPPLAGLGWGSGGGARRLVRLAPSPRPSPAFGIHTSPAGTSFGLPLRPSLGGRGSG